MPFVAAIPLQTHRRRPATDVRRRLRLRVLTRRSAQRVLDEIQPVIAPEQFTADEKCRSAEDSPLDGKLSRPPKLVFRVLVVDRTEELARIDAGNKKDLLKDLLVAKVQRIPPRRREDRRVIAIEDPQFLAGHRATHKPQRIAEEREWIALEVIPCALPSAPDRGPCTGLRGNRHQREFPVAFSTAPRSIGR